MISPINGQHEHDEYEPLPHIEPLFWGTSDMLLWEQKALLAQLKQNVAAGKEPDGDLTTEELEGAVRLIPDGAIDARAIYGYFPVIIEKGTIVVIDPSDFHSEIAILTLHPEVHYIAESIQPDGDLLAIQALTLGNTISKTLQEEGPDTAVRKTAEALIAMVSEKCTMEIRRGMGIPDDGGTNYSCGKILSAVEPAMSLLFEAMGIEERLTMFAENDGKTDPEYSSFSLFFPRLKVMDAKK